MAGRVEDALRIHERKPRENYRRQDYIWRAMLLASVGRADDARAAVADALAYFPGVSIESYARKPGWSDAEREKVTEAMRKAGFPACARPVFRSAPGPRTSRRPRSRFGCPSATRSGPKPRPSSPEPARRSALAKARLTSRRAWRSSEGGEAAARAAPGRAETRWATFCSS